MPRPRVLLAGRSASSRFSACCPARFARCRARITRRITFNNIYPQESFSEKSNSACYLRGGSREERGLAAGGRVREAHRVKPRSAREKPIACGREARGPAAEKRAQPRSACARESPAAPRELLVENGYARSRGVLTTGAHARNLHRCVNPGQRCCSALEYE